MFLKRKKKIEVERKERSDKKVQVAPIISVKLKTEIERLAFITDQPIKYVGELLCYEGVHTKDVVESLTPYFQRGSLRLGNSLFLGSTENKSLRERTDDDNTDRISIRFPQRDYADIRLLADLLDVSPSRAVAILLDASIRYPAIIERMIQRYNLRNSLDDEFKAEIRRLMRFVNRKNPYRNIEWNKTLVQIVDGVKDKVSVVVAPSREVMAKMADTETYRWELDNKPASAPKKAKSKRK